jgi:hypothetical protein
MVQRGRRAVVDPAALAWERPAPALEDEYRRKIRMFEHCWLILLRGGMLRPSRPAYLVALVSHRHLRYGSGVLHLALLMSSIALARSGRVYCRALGAQLSLFLAAAVRPGIARYYVVVTWATVPSLINYLRGGVSPVWEKVAGTR